MPGVISEDVNKSGWVKCVGCDNGLCNWGSARDEGDAVVHDEVDDGGGEC